MATAAAVTTAVVDAVAVPVAVTFTADVAHVCVRDLDVIGLMRVRELV